MATLLLTIHIMVTGSLLISLCWKMQHTLKNFVYNSVHVMVMKNRKKWFENFGQPYYVLWNIPAGYVPCVNEAVERLTCLQQNGASE